MFSAILRELPAIFSLSPYYILILIILFFPYMKNKKGMSALLIHRNRFMGNVGIDRNLACVFL